MKKMLLLTLILTLALAGCQPGTADTRLYVELGDFTIIPDRYTVKAGMEITVIVTNNGTIAHDFNIMKLGTDAGDMFDEQDLPYVLWEVEVQPGETLSATFAVPDEPGTYQVICSMPGHMQAGMTGTIEVIQ